MHRVPARLLLAAVQNRLRLAPLRLAQDDYEFLAQLTFLQVVQGLLVLSGKYLQESLRQRKSLQLFHIGKTQEESSQLAQ